MQKKAKYSERYILFTDAIAGLILLTLAWYFDFWSYCKQAAEWLFS